MKFIITRTSGYLEDGVKPCKEAVKIVVPYWHTRTCTEKYFNEHYASKEGLWRSRGKNHKKISSHDGLSKENWITRQEKDKTVWGIELNNLQDLLGLINKYGDLVLGFYENSGNEKIYTLEIYDGYRE